MNLFIILADLLTTLSPFPPALLGARHRARAEATQARETGLLPYGTHTSARASDSLQTLVQHDKALRRRYVENAMAIQ